MGFYFGRKQNTDIVIQDLKLIRKAYGDENLMIIGGSGSGKVRHPWDNLKTCNCGGFPLMVGKDNKDFYSGEPYKVVCTKCKKTTTQNNDISIIKKEWNNN